MPRAQRATQPKIEIPTPDAPPADFDAVAAEIAAAAELEGIKEMPEEVRVMRTRKLEIDAEMAKLETELSQIKSATADIMRDDAVVAYTIDGKVKARKSFGNRTGVDSKRLKTEMPHIYRSFLKTTPYTSMTIS